jgi:hypothetical protein
MRLSKSVKAIENGTGTIVDANCYRNGDLGRLAYKAKQLEARLPLQSTVFQVPYENTLGGFGMFSSGVTDLAPELTGWYGSPSINPKCATTLFLVGNHFSVHHTSVIAGGQSVQCKELLSRQVMKVVIPPGTIQLSAMWVTSPTGEKLRQTFVDVHVATPYGVTPHLLIPVCDATTYAACNPNNPCCGTQPFSSCNCSAPVPGSTTVTVPLTPLPVPSSPSPAAGGGMTCPAPAPSSSMNLPRTPNLPAGPIEPAAGVQATEAATPAAVPVTATPEMWQWVGENSPLPEPSGLKR